MFNKLSDKNLEQAHDVVSSGYSPVITDIYTAIVKMAYGITSSGGALGVHLSLYLPALGREYNETIYVSDKSGNNYSIDKQSGKKRPLPGFTIINDLCLVTCDSPLASMETEDKLVPVYDYEEKKQVPTSVPVLTDLLGKEVYVAIFCKEENKKVKQDNGEYVATPETRMLNSIEKMMHNPSKMTVREAESGMDTATYYDAWLEANKGRVLDRRTIKSGSSATTESSNSAPTKQATKTSLFGKKS